MSGEIQQQADKIETGKVITIGITALVIFAVGIVWAVAIQRESNGSIRSFTPEQVPEGKRDEIGIVYQPGFEHGDFAAKLNAEKQAVLSGVSWVDKDKKRVQIPIDRAIKDYLADAEKNGGKL